MKRLILALLALFAVAAAHAQVYPSVPPNTVLGRLGASLPGQPQAITLSNLANALGGISSQTSCVKPTAESANYSPVGTDSCDFFVVSNRSTISFNAGPAYPTSFHVWLYNANTVTPMAVTVTLNGNSYFLWPGQLESVYGDGINLYYTGPHRYSPAAVFGSGTPPAVYVGPSGSCSDANDGLTANTAGQVCDISTAYLMLQTYYDSMGHNPQIDLADGSYTISSTVILDGGGPHMLDQVLIQGDASNSTAVVLIAGFAGQMFQVRDNIAVDFDNLKLNCNFSGSQCINASQFATADLDTVYVVGSGTPLQAVDGGHINIISGLTLGSNMTSAFFASGEGAEFTATGQSVTCAAPLAMTQFAYAADHAEIVATGDTFSGCASNTGARYGGNSYGLINTGGGGATYFPGSSGGSGPGYE